jgi:hypothetical protein
MIPARFLLIILAYCLTIAACTDPTDIGQGLLDEEEFFNTAYTDTFAINVHTFRSDSTYSSPSSTMPQGYLLGNMNDPVFGRSSASLYAQFTIPSSFSITNLDSVVLDSVVLSLNYNKNVLSYGDTLSKHNISVYEAEEPIGTGLLFSDQHFAYNPSPIGYRNQVAFQQQTNVEVRQYIAAYTTISSTDTVYHPATIDTLTLKPQLRIPLNDELGWRFLSRIGTQEMKSKDNFQQFFKGLYVKADVSGNSIGFISLAEAAIVVYYRNGSSKGLSFRLPVLGGMVNHFDHNYNNCTLNDILNAASPNGQDFAYLQGINGTQFEFEVPSFTQMSGKIINKAVLEMTILPETDSTYSAPFALSSYAVGETGNRVYLYSNSTVNNASLPYYVSTYSKDSTTIPGQDIWKLQLNYRDFADELLSGQYKKLGVRTYSYLPQRAIICGPNHPQYPMRWKVYYTDPE